jgi:hypothetical protein
VTCFVQEKEGEKEEEEKVKEISGGRRRKN